MPATTGPKQLAAAPSSTMIRAGESHSQRKPPKWTPCAGAPRLAKGAQLFGNLSPEHIELERTRVLEGDGVTHMHYRVSAERDRKRQSPKRRPLLRRGRSS